MAAKKKAAKEDARIHIELEIIPVEGDVVKKTCELIAGSTVVDALIAMGVAPGSTQDVLLDGQKVDPGAVLQPRGGATIHLEEHERVQGS